MDVALGCLLLRKTSSTPAVVPGAAPALAKAGVGGYLDIFGILPILSHISSSLIHILGILRGYTS